MKDDIINNDIELERAYNLALNIIYAIEDDKKFINEDTLVLANAVCDLYHLYNAVTKDSDNIYNLYIKYIKLNKENKKSQLMEGLINDI